MTLANIPPVQDTEAPIREELERFAREMEREKMRRKRSLRIAEARGRIIVMLIGLSRYESHYEAVRASLEDEWRY
jgi:hypothetical protein